MISVTTTLACYDAKFSFRPYTNEWAWLSPNKTLITKTGGWLDLVHRQFICCPSSGPFWWVWVWVVEEGLAKSQEQSHSDPTSGAQVTVVNKLLISQSEGRVGNISMEV